MDTNASQPRKNFVFELLKPEMLALQEILKERNWTVVDAPYMVFKASSEKISVAAYQSGKLVVQGANAQDFVEFILEPEILKEKAFESVSGQQSESEVPFYPHAGMDESGKGDFFGPLVISSVFVGDEDTARKLADIGVKDSKMIKNDKMIIRIAAEIRRLVNNKFAVVAIGPEAYNNFYEKIRSLNRLLAWGHARALENLLLKAPECNAALADKFGELAEDTTKGPIFVCQGDCMDDVKLLDDMLKEKYGLSIDMTVYTGAVIGSHSGPNTLSIFFVGKER